MLRPPPWQIASRRLVAASRPMVMGILNVTPDSFSDGGRFLAVEDAVRRGIDLAKEGADILDIGGESTRPGAVAVPEDEEARRVVPVIAALAAAVSVPISVDTRRARVADAALEAGAVIVNDVEAGRSGPEMWRVVRDARAGYVCMHMKGDPANMQRGPAYADVVSEVREFLVERLRQMVLAGIEPGQVALDPGIGFGKAVEHNIALLRALPVFAALGQPVLVGVSRKSFIGAVTGSPELSDRLHGGLACAVHAARCGVAVIRTHDVGATRKALEMNAALQSWEAGA